ncbi:FAD-binding and (Fe-S)-binding domain-containing protein [Corynebacterium choanae]|uniref:D-lactate dehydrogenase (cytochrome) n=1 Tax=Corynebacterium choanae TaxID=1862358 RepID=A0A3G6J649_9CORY|nr:FAD-binding and (Fe-S)-binding domain-containing protein [Corynebacterium choanae]AZA13537.1 glycolate oxidase subunit GlcD [Corynebacterium choanae]
MKKIASATPEQYGRPAGATAQPDRVADDRASGADPQTIADLAAIVGQCNVAGRISDVVRYASDGSPYRAVPQVVVKPRNAQDLSAIMRWAKRNDRKLVFRAGGSSLNGQAMAKDVMVDVKTHFTGMKVLDGGKRLWSRPGVVLGDAQAVLGRHGYMLGPDPGSTTVACLGGIVADNSGGMRCTVEQDSYHCLEDAVFVLPSGTIVDTRDPQAAAKLTTAEPRLVAGLLQLRDEIRSDAALVTMLREKFAIRNTNGLRLDAFLDEDSPERILLKLLVGSEGIFGCLTEVVMRTVPVPKYKACAWLILPDVKAAANYVAPLVAAGATACELLVAPMMKEAIGNFRDARESWADMPDEAGALLLELGATTQEGLAAQIDKVHEVLAAATLLEPLSFFTDPQAMRGAWQIRSGLFGLVGKLRRQGSTMITEDVCFPPAKVGEGSAALVDLLREYGFDATVMGHATFGNLHFFIAPKLDVPAEKENYAKFIEALAKLVIEDFGGSLKAEHGTGVNMAPFVEYEWGSQAYELFWRVKELIDPALLLAPDVKLTRNQQIHLQGLKSFPIVEEEIADCVECGMCEPVCPSRHVSVTPRHRIALRREMSRQPEGSPVLRQLQEEYDYDAVQLCAADASCAIACPVSIDTGALMKKLREKQHNQATQSAALHTAKHYDLVEKAARASMMAASRVGSTVGFGLLQAAADAGRTVISKDLLPTVPGPLPQAAPAQLPSTTREGATAVYVPACINRIFGNPHGAARDQLTVPQAIVELGRRSGAPVWIPDHLTGLCCGTPWSSKGYTDGFYHAASKMVTALLEFTNEGELPVIIDAASCTHGLVGQVRTKLHNYDPQLAARFAKVEVLDVVQWLEREVIDHLPITTTLGNTVVHPTCSTMHMGIDDALLRLAQRVTTSAVIPDGARCCGTAGDRVLLHPELVESATREERDSLNDGFEYFVSDNRTCEMGLEMIAGKPYQSIACLLERASRPLMSS